MLRHALAEPLTGRRCSSGGSIAERVGAVLEGNAVVGALEEVLEAPGSLDDAARAIRSRFSDREGLALDEVRREVEGYPAFLTGVRRERPEMPMMVGERRAREPSRSCRYVAGSEA